MKKSQLVLCFSCANVFRLKKEMNLTCPECGFTVNLDNYEKLFKYANDAVYFGYCYRKTYEKDFKNEGKITNRYALAPLSEIFIFIGIAAICGIIGGISYDIVKKVISKMKYKTSNIKIKYYYKDLNKILNDSKELRIFIEYIDEFCGGLNNIKQEIKYEIKKEMFICMSSKIIFEKKPKSKKEIYESFLRANELIENIEKPKSSNFKNFWNNLK